MRNIHRPALRKRCRFFAFGQRRRWNSPLHGCVPPYPQPSRRQAMSLKERLTSDMKIAMKAGEKDRLGVIRLVNAAIKQREVDERIELDDAQVLAVLEKMLKQRKDS